MDYSEHLCGRDIRALHNLNRSNAKESFEITDGLELEIGTSLFPFEDLPGALIRARQGRLEQPNAVIKVSSW